MAERDISHSHFQTLNCVLILCKTRFEMSSCESSVLCQNKETHKSSLVQRLKTRIWNTFTSGACTVLSSLFPKPLAGGWRGVTMHFTVEQFNAILQRLIIIAGTMAYPIISGKTSTDNNLETLLAVSRARLREIIALAPWNEKGSLAKLRP